MIDANDFLVPGASLKKEVQEAFAKEIPPESIREKIEDVIKCVEFRSRPEMIRMRLTRSTFLNPQLLSKMSGGKISPEDAHLLLTCLGIKTNAAPKMVCDLRTSEASVDVRNLLRKKQAPSLVFVKPQEVKAKAKLVSTITADSGAEDATVISRGTVLLAEEIFKALEQILKPLDPQRWEIVKLEFPRAASDHTYLRKLFFDENCFQKIFEELFSGEPQKLQPFMLHLQNSMKKGLDNLDELVKKLPTKGAIMDQCLTTEALNRLEQAVKEADRLEQKFNEVKHIIRPFLFFSTQEFELSKPHHFELQWKMADLDVQERLDLEKSCSIARRLQFSVANGERSDLPYFDQENKPSVVMKWQELTKKYTLTDSQLADHFLQLYRSGDSDAPIEIKQFLVPLVILLMGKEPSLDRASLIANFILMFSVKLGLNSFSDALESMPVIPQGGVSAKQFLLHTSDQPIDALSGVQYKKSAKLTPSHFLPTVSSFIGRADDWIEKYNYIATAAVECCQRLFVGPLDEKDARFLALKKNLEEIELRELPVMELPSVFDCKKLEEMIDATENICRKFALSFPKVPADKAMDFCCNCILQKHENERVQSELIIPLQERLGVDYPPEELIIFLDRKAVEETILQKKQIANEFLISMGEADDLDTAADRCQSYFSRGINPQNPLFQNLKTLLDKIYKFSVPIPLLGQYIEYAGINDDQDEIGKWAIDYLCRLEFFQHFD